MYYDYSVFANRSSNIKYDTTVFTHYVSFDCQVLLKMTHVASEYEEVAKNNHDMECIMK